MTRNTRHTLILAVLLALLISIAPAGIAQETDTNTALVQTYIEAWNTGDTSVLAPLLSADHITQTPIFGEVAGGEALDALIANTRSAMPDYAFTVENITDFGGQVYVRGTITGTHSGPLTLDENLPIIPSDNAINVRAMLTITMAGGKISRVEWIDDTFTMMTQMGAAKSPADVLKERRNTEVIQMWADIMWTGELTEEIQDKILSIYPEFFVRHTPNNRQTQRLDSHGILMQIAEVFRAAFPDGELSVISITATGDYVTLVYEFTGTFVKDAGSPNNLRVEATGKEYSFDGAFVFKLEDGLIAEEWWYWDNELFAKVDYGYAD